MFAADQVLLDVSFDAATTRLASLVRGRSLVDASREAYCDGAAVLLGVGPNARVQGQATQVAVHFRELVTHGHTAVMPMRWEAPGPDDGLFPVLDADIKVTGAGEQAALLDINAAYRPPLSLVGAAADRAVLGKVTTATVTSFLRRLADAITHPASAAASGAMVL